MREVEAEHYEPTRQELYDEARERDIEGRSTMSKDEPANAVENARK